MRVNSLAFDLLKAFDTKASSPKETKQAPTAPVRSEPVVFGKPAESVRTAQAPIVNGLGLGLQFAVDDATGRSIIRVYDVETGEVIRQIPPQEVLAFLRQYESQRGLFFSRKL